MLVESKASCRVPSGDLLAVGQELIIAILFILVAGLSYMKLFGGFPLSFAI